MPCKDTRLFALLALSLAFAPSCGGPTSNEAKEEPQTDTVKLRREALTDITDNVVITQYNDFLATSTALKDATAALKASPESAEALTSAQNAWRDAMTSWQKAEVFQVGPAGIMGEIAGGEDLRDAIYSWPLTNACRIDQELAKNAFNAPDYLSGQLVNVKGLDALEYALFYQGERNQCAPNSTLNRGTDWSSLSAQDRATRRAEFAAVVAIDLEAQASSLVSHWSADGKDFRAQMINAGSSSQTYGSTQEALNALSDAMFYIEKETKDMKLAVPAGIGNCDTMTCPDELEHPYAQFSLEASRANHVAFQKIYLGNSPGETEAKGFDDLLVELGQQELDDEIQGLITAAIDAHDAIDMPLVSALEQDFDKVNALYSASQKLGLTLKTQFVGVLDLELPQRAEGDND